MEFLRRTPAQISGAGPSGGPDQGSARDARAQAVYRLQVGLFGLAGMLLLIGLANIIMDRAQLADAANQGAPGTTTAPAAASSSGSGASDPLVDMGVAPELPMADTPPAVAPLPADQSPQGQAPAPQAPRTTGASGN